MFIYLLDLWVSTCNFSIFDFHATFLLKCLTGDFTKLEKCILCGCWLLWFLWPELEGLAGRGKQLLTSAHALPNKKLVNLKLRRVRRRNLLIGMRCLQRICPLRKGKNKPLLKQKGKLCLLVERTKWAESKYRNPPLSHHDVVVDNLRKSVLIQRVSISSHRVYALARRMLRRRNLLKIL